MVLYGGIGVGKTKLACEIGSRPLLVAAEPGDETLIDWPELHQRVTVMDYGGINTLNAIVKAVRSGELTNDTVIIDTIDELVEIMLDDLVNGYQISKETRPTAHPKPGTGLRKLEMAGTDDYRLLRDGIRPSIRNLCNLPVNVILTSHVREPSWADEDRRRREGGQLPALRPDLPDKTWKLVSKYVGLIGHMTRRGEKRQISFRTDTTKEEVKSRVRELDGRVINADELPTLLHNWSLKVND
jgi:hypothetical protein